MMLSALRRKFTFLIRLAIELTDKQNKGGLIEIRCSI